MNDMRPCLLADIGGTNARFALSHSPLAKESAKSNRLYAQRTISVKDFANFQDAIANYLEQALLEPDLPFAAPPQSACFAVAGPVDQDDFSFTNSSWSFSQEALKAAFSFETLLVINDFAAQSWALSALEPQGLTCLKEGVSDAVAPRVVLGPGTGLGVGALIKTKQGFMPISGEGGHMGFKPQDALDLEILRLYWQEQARVSDERILAGFGLEALYRIMHRLHFDAQETSNPHPKLTAKQIVFAALSDKQPFALSVIDRHLLHLGALGGDLALLFMAKGGVYLNGGVAQALASYMPDSPLVAGFMNKGRMQKVLTQIPLFLINDANAALLGTRHALKSHLVAA